VAILVLVTLHEGVETVRQTEAGQRGRVTIGAIQPLCDDFLTRTVERFGASHPGVDLFVRVGHSEQVVAMLHDRVVHVGVIGGWPPDRYDPAIAVLHRARRPLVLIVPPGNPLDRRTDVRLCDVAEAATPLYLVEWTAGLRALIDEAVRPARALVEIPFEMAHRFVASGRGATFATRAMVADDLAAGRLCAVPVSDLPPLSYENAVVSLRGVSLPRSVAAFLDVLRAEIGAGADANTCGCAPRL